MSTKTKTRTGKRPTRGKVAADDACPSCGTMMVRKCSTLGVTLHGERISVPSVSHLKCPACDEVMLDLADARRQTDQAQALYRVKYGLLSGDEVRAIREDHGVSLTEFATMLRVSERAVSGWETGRIVQGADMDLLLRLVRDLPDAFEFLKKRIA
jgi:putative zinc finger/helix-turn-helix YgiT family protein